MEQDDSSCYGTCNMTATITRKGTKSRMYSAPTLFLAKHSIW